MIEEIKLNTVSNTLPKVNKKPPPRSINPDLTPCYFSACFVGAKNSGKSYGLCTFIKNYQDNPIKDHMVIHYKLELYYLHLQQIVMQTPYIKH